MWMVQQDIRDIKVRFASKTLCNLEWQWAVLEIYQVLDNTAAEYGTDPYLPFFLRESLGPEILGRILYFKDRGKDPCLCFSCQNL